MTEPASMAGRTVLNGRAICAMGGRLVGAALILFAVVAGLAIAALWLLLRKLVIARVVTLQRHFDARNWRVLRGVLVLALLISLITVVAAADQGYFLALAFSSVVLIVKPSPA